MVKNRIKVYARLKKEKSTKNTLYDIVPRKDCDILTIYQDEPSRSRRSKFRFDKVFNTCSTQSEIFEGIARPVINGVMSGFNGTIFAYGPTGSGKTYSLTGSHSKYANRGLIPRTIEYVFGLINKSINNYMIHISYLEIYNEVAYDLLNPKQKATALEELPRVLLLEDNKGEAHYKNLSVRSVCSEEEAMRLLFLGDTNRTIAETPLNEYSSRSHCIFTVHVTSRNHDTGKIRKSKLNLVDLAGSERLHKMNLNGVTLSEAKYINLSLHYLEQVILAISESKRAHVPFRNSIMTFMLRDSISGNCLTAMLATLAITRINVEEAVTTCKFAQRVSMVKTDVRINEECDPYLEISLLKNEVLDLRKRLADHNLVVKLELQLTEEEKDECTKELKNYINGGELLSYDDIRKVKFYIEILRDELNRKSKEKQVNTISSEVEQKYKLIIKQKEEEIAILMNIFNNKIEELKLVSPRKKLLTPNQTTFKEYLLKTGNDKTLNFYTDTLNEKYALAADISSELSKEQIKITNIRKDIDTNCQSFDALEKLSFMLKSEQNVYRELLLKLKNIKSEIEYLKHGMNQAKVKLFEDFKKWVLAQNGIGNKIYTSDEKDFNEIKNKLIETSFLPPCPHYNEFSITEKSCYGFKPQNTSYNINAELDALFRNTETSHKSVEFYQNNNSNLSHRSDIDYLVRNQEPVKDNINLLPNHRIEISPKISLDSLESMAPTKDTNSTKNNYRVQSLDFQEKKYSSGAYQSDCTSTAPSCSSQSTSAKVSNINLDLFDASDTEEFKEFIKSVPLTGDYDIDDEIVKFYRIKFKT